ncbi:MAG: methionine adenosyltransferase [Clostridia bacterium]|nr:methionine adenosyltransferase [Clostridia bacterium]
MSRFFTSESVTEGHPDKVCDMIADSILDELLCADKNARSAVECCAAYNTLFMTGEVTANAKVNYEKTAREVIHKIGYDFGGFAYDKCRIIELIHGQSADIALGVDNSKEKKEGGGENDLLGAGDQGMMFGYACRETQELMPLPIMLAHKLAEKLTEVRKKGKLKYLRPDGKTQVTVEYDGRKPVRVDTIVVSTQHTEEVAQEKIAEDIKKYVIGAVVPKNLLDDNTKYYINPTGKFVIGGPEGDSGLTGRKIVVDTYGGRCPHGGGSFSGKDPTKVDRSATYMARYICKNMVAAGLAEEMELQVAYAIGVAHPVSVFVDSFGTGLFSDEFLAEIVKHEFDLRPSAIISELGLRRPIYAQTAAYGHFGRKNLPWEQTDRVKALKKYLKEV